MNIEKNRKDLIFPVSVRKIIDIYNRLCNSSDTKELINNFFFLTLLKFVGYLSPLIVLPYLTHTIGVEKFGEIAFSTSVIAYFEIIVNYGFDYTATRDVAQHRSELSYVSILFSRVLFSKLFLVSVSFVLFLICIKILPFLKNYELLLMFTFLYIPGTILFPEWFFQAMEKMKYITIINICSKLIFTMLIFIVIKEKKDYIYQPLLIASGYFISGVIAFYIILKKFCVKIIVPHWRDIFLCIKQSTNMFMTLFLPNLYTNFSILILTFFCGNIATGIYSAAYKFILLSEQLTQILSRVFYPFLARRLDKHSFYVKITGWLSCIMGLLLFFGAESLIHMFYDENFENSISVVKLMSITPFFLFLMNTYGTNYLVLIGQERILRNIILFCSILGCIMAFIVIQSYSFIGVALTITLVWGIRGGLTYWYALKFRNYDKNISCR